MIRVHTDAIMLKYSSLFTIEKKAGKALGSYTHDVYFKGILLSERGYYEKDVFHMDGTEGTDIEEFFSLKIAELPPWLVLYIHEHYLYKELRLGIFDLKDSKVNFDIEMEESDFISSPGKFPALRYAALAAAAELYGGGSEFQDDLESVYWTITVEWQGEETVEDVYRRVKKEAMKFYDVMLLKAKSALN